MFVFELNCLIFPYIKKKIISKENAVTKFSTAQKQMDAKRPRSEVENDVENVENEKNEESSSLPSLPSLSRHPEFFLVLLTDVYGSTENYHSYYTVWSQLSPEERDAIHRSTPDSRRGKVPGCDDNHDFGAGYDIDGNEETIPNNIWKSIMEDKDLQLFTRAHHCETTVAYFNE